MSDTRLVGLSPAHHAFDAIIGSAPALRQVLERAARIARTSLPVLVTGESGTGKELLARALHDLGPASSGPFVAVNCGALPRELAESELFGHERGAFTGAATRKLGWFEEASGGTLVLDEVGELPLALQPKLLRVLETGRLRRVGGQGDIEVKVRVIALTLRDLRADANKGVFRLDLYHRLAGCELRLPPLRERRDDIRLLVEHFLAQACAELGPKTLAPDAWAELCAHDWPGNVRELRNTLRRAAALADAIIGREELSLGTAEPPPALFMPAHACRAADSADDSPPALATSDHAGTSSDTLSLTGKSFTDMQKAIFRWALRKSRGSQRKAASALGISRSTFSDRVRKLGLTADPTAIGVR